MSCRPIGGRSVARRPTTWRRSPTFPPRSSSAGRSPSSTSCCAGGSTRSCSSSGASAAGSSAAIRRPAIVHGVPNATVHVEDTDCSFLGLFPVENPAVVVVLADQLPARGHRHDDDRRMRQLLRVHPALGHRPHPPLPARADLLPGHLPADPARPDRATSSRARERRRSRSTPTRPTPPFVLPDRRHPATARLAGSATASRSGSRSSPTGDLRRIDGRADGAARRAGSSPTDPRPPLDRRGARPHRGARPGGTRARAARARQAQKPDLAELSPVEGDRPVPSLPRRDRGRVAVRSSTCPTSRSASPRTSISTATRRHLQRGVLRRPLERGLHPDRVAQGVADRAPVADLRRPGDPVRQQARHPHGRADAARRDPPRQRDRATRRGSTGRTRAGCPAAAPSARAQAPYAGTLQLHGCHHIAGAQFYRLLYSYEGKPEQPFLGLEWYPPELTGPPWWFHAVPDADGWYDVLPEAQLVFPHWLLNWPTSNGVPERQLRGPAPARGRQQDAARGTGRSQRSGDAQDRQPRAAGELRPGPLAVHGGSGCRPSLGRSRASSSTGRRPGHRDRGHLVRLGRPLPQRVRRRRRLWRRESGPRRQCRQPRALARELRRQLHVDGRRC